MKEIPDTNLYRKAEQFMQESFGTNQAGPRHLRRTADWVAKLRPDADEALLIAALCHDIERAEKHAENKSSTHPDKITGEDYLIRHQERSARIMHEFLILAGASPDFADRVLHLIEKHEVGGDEDQNLLKDADSISFFENNTDLFLEKGIHIIGREETIRKFQWMFNRITSREAQEIARPLFLDAMKRIQA